MQQITVFLEKLMALISVCLQLYIPSDFLPTEASEVADPRDHMMGGLVTVISIILIDLSRLCHSLGSISVHVGLIIILHPQF